MKSNLLKSSLWLMLVFLLAATRSFGQGENINLQAGNYDKDPYPAFNPDGTVTGTYTIRASKSAHTFTAEQFTINIAFPAGAVYAGNASLPSGFSIIEGADGSSAVVIGITGNWSGTGPTALRTFVIPIKIVGASSDEPTGTVLQWLDPFVTENPVANSTGSPLNVEDVNLPVTLTSFIAAKEGTTANLRWSTTEESNSDRFEIERSSNAKNWAKIGMVKSSGESKVLKSYTFTDASPASGTNYYRLKMVDADNTFAYSQIRNVTFGNVDELVSFYPNPASEELHVQIQDWTTVSSVKLRDLNGRVVRQAQDATPMDIKSLAPGLYVVQITGTDGISNSHKITIAR